MRNNRQAKDDATKKSAAAQSKRKPQRLQLPLSRTARKTLNALARELERELSPKRRAELRAFARQHGYRYADAREAAVVLAITNLGESTEVA